MLAVAEGTSHFDLKIIFFFKQIPVVVPMVNATQECSRPSDLQPALLLYKVESFLCAGFFLVVVVLGGGLFLLGRPPPPPPFLLHQGAMVLFDSGFMFSIHSLPADLTFHSFCVKVQTTNKQLVVRYLILTF